VLFARFFQKVYFGNGKKAKGATSNGMSSVNNSNNKQKAH
jgi:hypothetical protein